MTIAKTLSAVALLGFVPLLAACDAEQKNAAKEAEPVSAAASGPVIPARYHGTWDGTEADCARPSSETRLMVGPRLLNFYESTGAVEAVSEDAAGTLRVRISFTGEGEKWRETRNLTLSPAGDALTVFNETSTFTRLRC